MDKCYCTQNMYYSIMKKGGEIVNKLLTNKKIVELSRKMW